MQLLIISNMEHYIRDGSVLGWGPTVQEIDQLAKVFSAVTHIGCLHRGTVSGTALPYQAKNLKFVGVPPAGGATIWHKLGILLRTPVYAAAILKELPQADVVHVRCPANVSLFAIILLSMFREPKKRWVKYAGNWSPLGKEAWSYTFQRWWLKRNICRAKVTVNGQWPNQPCHVHAFRNPCLSEEELAEGRKVGLSKTLEMPIQLLYVGRVETPKGARRALSIVRKLTDNEIPVSLDIVGDGPERLSIEQEARACGLKRVVTFHGWVKRTELQIFYRRAHFLLLPTSASEGWPKVLSESMAYGAIPIAGSVSSIPQFLNDFGVGRAVRSESVEDYASTVMDYIKNPEKWREESGRAIAHAEKFSYGNYLKDVCALLRIEEA